MYQYCGIIVYSVFTFTFTYPLVMDRRGATGVLATNSLHSSRLSAFLKVSLSCSPVHSFMLSSHLFFCLPLFLPPGTVPCSMVFDSPDDLSGHNNMPEYIIIVIHRIALIISSLHTTGRITSIGNSSNISTYLHISLICISVPHLHNSSSFAYKLQRRCMEINIEAGMSLKQWYISSIIYV